MVHMPHLFGKSGSKAAATPKTLTPSGSEKDFDLGQTAEKGNRPPSYAFLHVALSARDLICNGA
jgi:hypothetical protein